MRYPPVLCEAVASCRALAVSSLQPAPVMRWWAWRAPWRRDQGRILWPGESGEYIFSWQLVYHYHAHNIIKEWLARLMTPIFLFQNIPPWERSSGRVTWATTGLHRLGCPVLRSEVVVIFYRALRRPTPFMSDWERGALKWNIQVLIPIFIVVKCMAKYRIITKW